MPESTHALILLSPHKRYPAVAQDLERKQQYATEVAVMKNVRPHQIISGEVIVKPPPKPVVSPSKVGHWDVQASRGFEARMTKHSISG